MSVSWFLKVYVGIKLRNAFGQGGGESELCVVNSSPACSLCIGESQLVCLCNLSLWKVANVGKVRIFQWTFIDTSTNILLYLNCHVSVHPFSHPSVHLTFLTHLKVNRRHPLNTGLFLKVCYWITPSYSLSWLIFREFSFFPSFLFSLAL